MDNTVRQLCETAGDQLVVFYVQLGALWDDDFKFETALRLLPFQQQTQIISKKFSKDAQTALANQLLQRYVCCQLTGQRMDELEFTKTKYGKPLLRHKTPISFSMSNQRGHTAMVVSLDERDVGIDLASLSDVVQFGEDYIEGFKGIFHPAEYEYLQTIQDEEELKSVFTHFWALKESYTKKLGVGLNGDLASYNFDGVRALHHNEKSTEQVGSLTVRQRDWDSGISLRVYGHEEKMSIMSTTIDDDVVVSICRDGSTKSTPLLVQVPLDHIVDFFS